MTVRERADEPEPCDTHCDMGCVDAAADHAVIDCVAEVCQVVDGPYSSYY